MNVYKSGHMGSKYCYQVRFLTQKLFLEPVERCTADIGGIHYVGLFNVLCQHFAHHFTSFHFSRVHLAENGHYSIVKGDHDSLVDFVERISYYARNSGKFSSGEEQRIFSTSKVRMKESN